jgi:hypothetical protein
MDIEAMNVHEDGGAEPLLVTTYGVSVQLATLMEGRLPKLASEAL